MQLTATVCLDAFLGEGTCPEWVISVKIHTNPAEKKKKVFASKQEHAQKDTECGLAHCHQDSVH